MQQRYVIDLEKVMELDLGGRVAIVTGASQGIGRAIAQKLAKEGMNLVLTARSREGLNSTAAECNTECLIQDIDLREPNAAETIVSLAIQRYGKIDLLVNNAGATKRGDFLKLTDEEWMDGFALKFFGGMRMSRVAWDHLKVQKGSIIFISGIGGRTGSAEFTIGGAVNAALLNLTKSLADRGARDGIRVNAVNPSGILTERLRLRVDKLAEELNLDETEATEMMCRKLGVTRFGKPEEIASMVAFLASPVAAFCHASIIDVDGGKTLTL